MGVTYSYPTFEELEDIILPETGRVFLKIVARGMGDFFVRKNLSEPIIV